MHIQQNKIQSYGSTMLIENAPKPVGTGGQAERECC